ncbi:interferon-related developmental regulator-domain-containing protein [Lipomyces oligophaga]|uniref:interferon-related developmental regulator-domain-containing protein n=1 Tax=Lipomyces oligophaga TaxID=45792 RepID=UPI0034CD50E1
MSSLRKLAVSRLATRKSSSRTRKTSKEFDDEDEYDDNFSVISDSDWSVASLDTLDSFGTDNESSPRSPGNVRLKDGDISSDWRDKLEGYIDILSIERKHSNSSSREDAMSRICKIASLKYAWRIAERRHGDLEDGITRSLKYSNSSKEKILACKMFSIFVITDPENEGYFKIVPIFKSLILSDENLAVKEAAITALGVVVFFSGASGDSEIDTELDFLLDIIMTDGSSISAADSGEVVSVAINVFGFLISKLDDALDISQTSMPILVDQLESSQMSVRMAAGYVIALLYERFSEDIGNYHLVDSSDEEQDNEEQEIETLKERHESRNGKIEPLEEDEEYEEGDEPSVEIPKPIAIRPQPQRMTSGQPTLYYDEDQLIYQLSQLATSSTKRVAKSSRKVQKSVFRDIVDTVRTAVQHENPDDNQSDIVTYERGNGDPIPTTASLASSRINRSLKFESITLHIESWAAYLRLAQVKKVLSYGLPVHFTYNRCIRLALDPQGSTTYELSRRPRAVPSGNESEDFDEPAEGGNHDREQEQDSDMKQLIKSVNKEMKKYRHDDLRKARETKERYQREMETW